MKTFKILQLNTDTYTVTSLCVTAMTLPDAVVIAEKCTLGTVLSVIYDKDGAVMVQKELDKVLPELEKA